MMRLGQQARAPTYTALRCLRLSSTTRKNVKPKEGKYSHTVILPKTTFEQRAHAAKREPLIQEFWATNRIYEKLHESSRGEPFVLHDGPPYANGDLHIGHALNKILKDIINRYNILNGKKVRYIPGWDCHGLPIELKVLQSMGAKEREKLSPITLRRKASRYADDAIASQMQGFKRYGVWGDWDAHYKTQQKEYESAQIRVFGEMISKGHIYRGCKPVHWSPSSQSALAEAELEYNDQHVSRSIYVGMSVRRPSDPLAAMLPKRALNTFLVVWTTTPWTLPANQAVAVRGDLEYSVLADCSTAAIKCYVVASALVESFCAVSNISTRYISICGTLRGSDLSGTCYQHPLTLTRELQVVVGGDYINTDSGTGLVHTAPGHGAEDFIVGQRLGLEPFSPVDELGRFTLEAGRDLEGLCVLEEGNEAVISALKSSGALIKEELYTHKYPYDWRTKKPTIFRTTAQWFASVDTCRDNALAAINSVEWVPAVGRNRISSMVSSRKDWCISRQRAWGVPIPVFYHVESGEALVTPETIEHIARVIYEHGADAWWEMSTDELLPSGIPAHLYEKGSDTMDVWFDSGTSWAGVLKSREYLTFPADLYLEGSDQHRGWFQSSLLTAVAQSNTAQAPYKAVLTHGFVLDEKGYKMSKSLGNVINPELIINGGSNLKNDPAYGADTLRLWVAGVDYSNDICIGSNIIKGVSDSYRKLRNTLRFLMGSLSGFNPRTDVVAIKDMPSLDKYILGLLSLTFRDVDEAYKSYQFYRAMQIITNFGNKYLSNFYLDISKDRLYISQECDYRRKSCQTVLSYVLEQYVLMMAPVLPHMAEDVWLNYPYPAPTRSIFERGWVQNATQFNLHEMELWETIQLIKDDTNRCMEVLRAAKEIGAPQECKVFIHVDKNAKPELEDRLRSMVGNGGEAISEPRYSQTNSVDDLRFILMASEVYIVDALQVVQRNSNAVLSAAESSSGVTIGVGRASGLKCERCWYYSTSVGADVVGDGRSGEFTDICARCESIIAPNWCA